jgi:hypothetical protein
MEHILGQYERKEHPSSKGIDDAACLQPTAVNRHDENLNVDVRTSQQHNQKQRKPHMIGCEFFSEQKIMNSLPQKNEIVLQRCFAFSTSVRYWTMPSVISYTPTAYFL